MKKFLKSYGGLVAVIIMLLMIAGSVFYVNYIGHDPVTPDPVLSKVVGEYTGTIKATDFGSSDSYAIGANSQGKPVFMNPEKAFEQALKDYKDEFDTIGKEGHLLPISKSLWYKYKTVSGDLVSGSYLEIWHATEFLDIYENSFKN